MMKKQNQPSLGREQTAGVEYIRQLLSWLVMALVLGMGIRMMSDAGAAETSKRKPNVIIILSDDAGYNEFSMNGSKEFQTPRIDSIAANGIRFTDGYVSGTVCSPSRAGLLTGRYQQKFGHEYNIPPAYSETNGLPLTETLLPAVMKANGYHTIGLGKWHLGYADKFHPMERGFTDFYGFLQGSRSYYPVEHPNRLNQLLDGRAPVKNESFEYMTDHLASKAVSFIEKYKNEPFFMYVAFNATHSPNHALAGDLDRAAGNKVKAMTIALDRAVGTILDGIEAQGLKNDTMVVFVNDNGGAGGHDNGALHGYKSQTWEGGIRIPFAIQWPGTIPSGQVSKAPVITLDLFATAMASAGIEKTTGQALDGVNLLPYMKGETKQEPQRSLYWKHGEAWAIRNGAMKLVGGNTDQTEIGLYDLSVDVGEKQNLAASKAEEVKALQADYQRWAQGVKDTPWGEGLKQKRGAAGEVGGGDEKEGVKRKKGKGKQKNREVNEEEEI